MTGGIGFIYFLTTLLVGVFSIGQSSVILFRHPRDRVVRSYLIFIGLITIKVFTWLLFAYLPGFSSVENIPLPLLLLTDIPIILTIWAVPHFIHAFFKVPFGPAVDRVTLFISIGMLVKYLLPIIFVNFNFELLKCLDIFAPISTITIVYSLAIAFIYHRRLPEPVMQKVGLTMAIVGTLFIPAFVVDNFFSDKTARLLLFTPLFYITWNLLALYFSTRYYLLKPKDEFDHIPMPGEQFYEAYNISNREREIIPLILKGHSNQEIADISFISLSTVKSHIYNIYRKVEVKSRFQFVAKVREFKKS